MKAVVTECFIDKFDNSIVYSVGEEVDFDEKRIEDLSERKLVKCIAEASAEKPKRKKATK